MTLCVCASVEMKFSIFANEMLLYVQNPNNSWKKNHRTNWVQQDHRYKVKILKNQLCIYILVMNMWKTKLKYSTIFQFSSVQFNLSALSDSLWPHGLQHFRPSSPSPTPRVYSNSCPLSWWCRPTISSSVVPFSSYLQSFPASGSFQMSQFFRSGGQSIGVSASSVIPMNTQDWSPLGWTGWIFLQSKGLSRVFSNTTDQKHQFFCAQLSL